MLWATCVRLGRMDHVSLYFSNINNMGKVKKVRQKLHQKAVRFPDEEQTKDPLKANEVISYPYSYNL